MCAVNATRFYHVNAYFNIRIWPINLFQSTQEIFLFSFRLAMFAL